MLGVVRLVQAVRSRLTVLSRELAKFGIIGIFNTVLDFAVWNALVFIGPLKAQFVATLVSATCSYFMNRQWTFRHRARSGLRREYILFFGFNAIGLAITAGILAVAAYGFGTDDRLTLNIVKVFAIVVATVFRFWAYQRWVFLHPDDALLDTGFDDQPPFGDDEPTATAVGRPDL
jgi:putative flippase GtrA